MKHLEPKITNPIIRRALAANLRAARRVSQNIQDPKYRTHQGSTDTKRILNWMVWNALNLANDLQWQVPETFCNRTEYQRNKGTMICSLSFRHYGDCKFTRVPPIQFTPEMIEQDTITDLTDDLNLGEDMTYSEDKVRRAVWRTLETIFGEMLEDLDSIVKEHDDWEKNLGAPDINRKEEERLTAGDMAFDAARGN